MRKIFRYASMAMMMPVAGCILDAVPPADGIYTGTLTTATGTDSVYAIIDSTGAGVLIDTTSPGITRFTVSSVDDSGYFNVSATSFAGSGFGVTGGNAASSGSISGTLDGSSSDSLGSSDNNRSTITGDLLTSTGASEPYTLTYQSSAYEDNVVSLSTIVTPTSSAGAASLGYSYTPSGSSTATAVSLTLSDTASSTTNGLAYPFTGSDSLGCSYSGSILMPDSSYNAFELSMTVNCSGTSTTRTGLAYVNGTSPTTLTLEYNDSANFAVAASATLTN